MSQPRSPELGLRDRLLAACAVLAFRALRLTWRIRVEEGELLRRALAAREPVVFAHWHGDELVIFHLVRRYRIATMVSHSRDGALMAEALRRLGGATVRGSSSRGGASAMRALVNLCRRGGLNASFAVDGPRGPLYRVKAGVFAFSRLMKAPIATAAVGVSHPFVLRRSWNQAVVPKPFSRVSIRLEIRIPAIGPETDVHDPALAAQLEESLHEGRALLDPGRPSRSATPAS